MTVPRGESLVGEADDEVEAVIAVVVAAPRWFLGLDWIRFPPFGCGGRRSLHRRRRLARWRDGEWAKVGIFCRCEFSRWEKSTAEICCILPSLLHWVKK
jgi:hypothetical protein